MELKQHKNTYGHNMVCCPFCDYEAFVRSTGRGSNPDPLRDLKRHITSAAKNEAFTLYIEDKSGPTPHLEYYKAHTSMKQRLAPSEKRTYDNDLALS